MFHATTIVGVLKNGKCALAADGQVTWGDSAVMKHRAVKVRRIYNGKVLAGFAGSVADALTLLKNMKNSWTNTREIYAVPLWNWPENGVPTGFCAVSKPCWWWLTQKVFWLFQAAEKLLNLMTE